MKRRQGPRFQIQERDKRRVLGGLQSTLLASWSMVVKWPMSNAGEIEWLVVGCSLLIVGCGFELCFLVVDLGLFTTVRMKMKYGKRRS